MFHSESLSGRSESSRRFTSSLFLAGRNRLGFLRRGSSSQSGVVQVLISSSQGGVVEVFQGAFLLGRLESSRFFTAGLSLAGRSRLGFSRRVSSLQVGVVYVFHGKSLPCRPESSRCFAASLFLAVQTLPNVSRRVASLQFGIVKVY